MRKALIVGIDHYENAPCLRGCVNDARSVEAVLARHGNGSLNFGTKLLVGTSATQAVLREELRRNAQELFAGESETALFYFAGHGHVEATGGYLIASDCRNGDEGLALSDVLTWASGSKARNKIIVLDSCYSGIAGTRPNLLHTAEIKEGMTILTASTEEQYASEKNGTGVFTTLLVDALSGSACNLLGDITPGSVYAHIDQSLGPWQQRPVFRTNVKSFVSLRTVLPPLPSADLRRIVEFFPSPGHHFPLDPTYEPERSSSDTGIPPPDPANTAKFAILQKYNRVNLVVPVDAPHMWHAAVGSKACKLTVLGEHYRRLVEEKLI